MIFFTTEQLALEQRLFNLTKNNAITQMSDLDKLHLKTKKASVFLQRLVFFGGSCEIRTRDQRIKSPLLYRLS